MIEQLSVRAGLREAFVILVSILAAFWIDAWWDERSAVRMESAVLGAVADELSRNQGDLVQNLRRLEVYLDRVDRFLRASDQELLDLPQDSVTLWLTALNGRASFNGDLEATSMLLQSAPLDSRESLAIRSRMASWRNLVDEAELLGAQLDEAQIRVEQMLARYALRAGSDGLDGTEDMVPQMAARSGAPGIRAIRRDEALVAAVISKTAAQRRHLMFLELLNGTVDELAREVRDLSER
jgi:hypothetical protein